MSTPPRAARAALPLAAAALAAALFIGMDATVKNLAVGWLGERPSRKDACLKIL